MSSISQHLVLPAHEALRARAVKRLKREPRGIVLEEDRESFEGHVLVLLATKAGMVMSLIVELEKYNPQDFESLIERYGKGGKS